MPGSKQVPQLDVLDEGTLCRRGPNKDAESGESSGRGENVATPNEEGKGGLGVKSWVRVGTSQRWTQAQEPKQGRLRGANTLILSPRPLTVQPPLTKPPRILGGSQVLKTVSL